MGNGLKLALAALAAAAISVSCIPCAQADLYITSWNGPGFIQYDNAGSLVRQVTTWSMSPQLAFGPDGDLYVISAGYGGEIARYDPATGALKSKVVTTRAEDYIYGMAFGPDGDLYVGFSVTLEGVKKVGHYNGPLKPYAWTQQADWVTGWPLYSPVHMNFGPDGDLYVYETVIDGGVVQHWSGTTPSTFMGNIIAGPNGGYPKFGPDGNFYIGTQRYQGPGGANPGQSMGTFIDLTGSGLSGVSNLAFNPDDGDVYAHDGVNVARFNGAGKANEGKYVSTFATGINAYLNTPTDMVFTPPPPPPMVPSSITYQGRLTNPSGEPVPDGSYQLQFKFYNTLSGGNLLWSSNAIAVETKSGLLTAQIDDIPVSTAFPVGDVWMEVSVQQGANPAETLSPRIKVNSVPFALRASQLAP